MLVAEEIMAEWGSEAMPREAQGRATIINAEQNPDQWATGL
jgi:hypothetical protein